MKEVSFLKSMVQKIGALRVLEIGTYDGTSAIAMAEALPPNGTVTTCEINPTLAGLARKRAARHPAGSKLDIRVGAAVDTLQQVSGPYDLIFVDADTCNYVMYYRCAMAMLSARGVLLMDNMRGSAIQVAPNTNDASIRAIQELSRMLASDDRVDATLMNVRDGVMVITPRMPALQNGQAS